MSDQTLTAPPILPANPAPVPTTPALQTTAVEPVMAPGVPTVQVPITAAPSKPMTQSLTVKFNGAIIILSLLTSLLVTVQPQLNQAIIDNFRTNPDLGVALVTALSSLFGLANVFIRIYKTSQPITH